MAGDFTDALRKRSGAVKLSLMGAGLAAVYAATSSRQPCPPEPKPESPTYAADLEAYQKCRNDRRRSSSSRSSRSSRSWGWSSSPSSGPVVSRGGFGRSGFSFGG